MTTVKQLGLSNGWHFERSTLLWRFWWDMRCWGVMTHEFALLAPPEALCKKVSEITFPAWHQSCSSKPVNPVQRNTTSN